MLKIALIIIGILVVIFAIVLIYSACVLASRSDKFMEQYESDILCEKDDRDLTWLENQTLERLLQLYEEDGVNFVINDGKIVDYEVE